MNEDGIVKVRCKYDWPNCAHTTSGRKKFIEKFDCCIVNCNSTSKVDWIYYLINKKHLYEIEDEKIY